MISDILFIAIEECMRLAEECPEFYADVAPQIQRTLAQMGRLARKLEEAPLEGGVACLCFCRSV